jgi:predicted dehydrogenase
LLLTSCTPPEDARAPKKTGLKTLNIALIGYGEEGKVLLESLINIDGVKIVAVCDIWEFHLHAATQYLKYIGGEANAYTDFEDLLAKEKNLDAAIVATPDFWHAPITNACLKAGLHVYCEKMMSNTIEGARSMVQTMRQTGKLLQIGHQRRSNPRYLFALDKLVRGQNLCGQLTAANAQWNRAVKPDFTWKARDTLSPETLAKYGYKDMHQFRNWRWFRSLGGGPLSDLGAHQIDIFNWWFNAPPKSVFASGGLDYYQNHEWYDNAMVIYEYQVGKKMARASYQVQTTTSAGGGYWEMFMGDQATIKISEDPKLTAIYREDGAPSWDDLIQRNIFLPKNDDTGGAKVDARETAALAKYDMAVSFSKPPHMPHLENFFNSIRGEAKLNCPADEAFRSEYVIHKANESIAKGQRLIITPEEVEA